MNGMDKVFQRISSIEQRFQQAKPAEITAQSFADVLQKAQKSTHAPQQEKEIVKLINQSAVNHGIDPKLALAVASAESSLNPAATSPVGAAGVMQLMPETARSLNVKDIYDPRENIEGGVRYLKQMLSTFNGDTAKALAAYNAGPEAVKQYGGVPPFAETQEYVAKILASYKE